MARRHSGTPFEWFEIDRRARLTGIFTCVGSRVKEAVSAFRPPVSKIIIREIPLTN